MSKGAMTYTLEPEAQQQTRYRSVLITVVDFVRSIARKTGLSNTLPCVFFHG